MLAVGRICTEFINVYITSETPVAANSSENTITLVCAKFILLLN